MEEKKKAQGSLVTKLLLAVIALLLVAIVILLVLLLQKPAAPQISLPEEVSQEQVVQELDPDDPAMLQATEATGVPVVTKYMRFTYPEELKEQLIVREEESEDRFQATFSMIAAEQEVELFTIILSQSEEEGYKVGTLADEQYGTVIITTRMNEQRADDWPPEAYEAICTMQERINDILMQFYEDPRFSPSH